MLRSCSASGRRRGFVKLRWPLVAWLSIGLVFSFSGCRRTRGEAKPAGSASASVAPAVSAAPPAAEEKRWSEPEASWFPLHEGELALDVHADVASFGGEEEPPIAVACALLAVECAELEALGLRRVLRVPYIGANGARGRAVVTLLRFDSAESAYAYFTSRLGQAADAGKPVFAALELPGAAVSGDNLLLAWKAEQFLEFRFSDERLAPEQVPGRASELLPPLARAVVTRLPGKATLPVAAGLLPVAGRKPLSIRYDRFDLAALPGVGPGARAAYSEGDETYEVALLVRTDADAAEDVLETLRKLPGARKHKNAPYRATRVIQLDEKTGRRVAWIFGQRNDVIAGVGAELEAKPVPRREAWELDPKVKRMKRLLDALRR
ncbi:MAG TPA: DUF6599 family protein [Polyangiaceae bacterium]